MARNSRSALTPAHEILYKAGIIFQIIGVIILLINGAMFIVADKVATTHEPLSATVMSVDNDDKTTTVKYTLGSTEYETTLSFWSSNTHTGDTITVYHKTDSNPYDVILIPSKSGGTTQLVLSIVGFINGFVLLIMGKVMTLKQSKYRRKLKYLKANGIPLDAHIVHIADSTTRVFGKVAKIFVCQYTDERGRTLIFDSEPIAINQDNPQLCNDLVRVYMDTNDYNKYIVDHTTLHIV